MGKLAPYVGIAIAVAVGVALATLVGWLLAIATALLLLGMIFWALIPFLPRMFFVLFIAAFLTGVVSLFVDPSNRRHSVLIGICQWVVILTVATVVRLAWRTFTRTDRITDRDSSAIARHP